MQVLIAFLLASFLIGGSGRLDRFRPTWLFLGFCVLVGASYLSLRVLG